MEQLRNMSYKELNEAMGWISFILMFVSGGALLIVTIPIWVLLLALKFGIDLYDKAQNKRTKTLLKINNDKNWNQLKDEILNLSGDQYFEIIKTVLNNLDVSHKPPKEGPIENWKFLNQRLEIALPVYLTILRFIQNNDLGHRKNKLETFCVIGLAKIDDFTYVFKIFERSTDIWIKGTLAETLALIAHAAPTKLLLIFLQYVNEDYRHLKSGLIKSIINRAQDFSKDEIEKTLTKEIYGDDKIRFYQVRTRYFFGKAYDYSAEIFTEDANSWLNMIIEDFCITGNRVYVELLDSESGLLLAIACRKLGKVSSAIFVLERVLDRDPSNTPAIEHLISIHESLDDYEKVKKVLIRVRKHVITSEWGQNKLSKYDLI